MVIQILETNLVCYYVDSTYIDNNILRLECWRVFEHEEVWDLMSYDHFYDKTNPNMIKSIYELRLV